MLATSSLYKHILGSHTVTYEPRGAVHIISCVRLFTWNNLACLKVAAFCHALDNNRWVTITKQYFQEITNRVIYKPQSNSSVPSGQSYFARSQRSALLMHVPSPHFHWVALSHSGADVGTSKKLMHLFIKMCPKINNKIQSSCTKMRGSSVDLNYHNHHHHHIYSSCKHG